MTDHGNGFIEFIPERMGFWENQFHPDTPPWHKIPFWLSILAIVCSVIVIAVTA